MLVNPTLLARVKWVYWDMYQHPSIGTLAYNAHTFVAGFQLEDGRRIPGELDFDRGLNGNIKVISFSSPYSKKIFACLHACNSAYVVKNLIELRIENSFDLLWLFHKCLCDYIIVIFRGFFRYFL